MKIEKMIFVLNIVSKASQTSFSLLKNISPQLEDLFNGDSTMLKSLPSIYLHALDSISLNWSYNLHFCETH
jgi:hypothetical protein